MRRPPSRRPRPASALPKFTGADSAFSFRSLGYVEVESGLWVETYVLSNGDVVTYRWRLDGEDAYRVVEETAPLDADAWSPGIVTITRRVPAAP